MSEKEPIRVFVSHLFSESDDYLRVFEYLESVDNFFYVNVSKPENTPSGSAEAFKEELLGQIKQSEAVIVLGSLYAQKADWGQYQIEAGEGEQHPGHRREQFRRYDRAQSETDRAGGHGRRLERPGIGRRYPQQRSKRRHKSLGSD